MCERSSTLASSNSYLAVQSIPFVTAIGSLPLCHRLTNNSKKLNVRNGFEKLLPPYRTSIASPSREILRWKRLASSTTSQEKRFDNGRSWALRSFAVR